jgi:hypothetical protein
MRTFLPIPALILILLLLIGCSKEDDKEEINNRVIYTYENEASYCIIDINLYSGPGGEKIKGTEEQVQSFFFTPLNRIPEDRVTIDLKNDSIYEFVRELKNSYKINTNKDSIFIKDKFGKSYICGILSKDLLTFTYYKSYYFYRRKQNSMQVETSGSIRGTLTYSDNFGPGILNYVDEDYSFLSPSDMKNEADAVCWVNVKYIFCRKRDHVNIEG